MTARMTLSMAVQLRYMSITGSMFSICDTYKTHNTGLPHLVVEPIPRDRVLLGYDCLLVLPNDTAVVVFNRHCAAYTYLQVCPDRVSHDEQSCAS